MLKAVWSLGLGLMLGATVGCGPKAGTAPGPVTPATLNAAQSHWPDATNASLEQGRQLFLEHCNKCHSYPQIKGYPRAKWPKTLERMARKAELSDTDEILLAQFVVSLSQATESTSGP